MSVEFPISSAALLTVLGLAFIVAVIVQIVKSFVTEPRALNLVAVGAGLIIALVAAFVSAQGHPTAETIFQACTAAIFAIGISTFGYEAIANLAGWVGYGPKSDRAQLDKAVKRVAKAGPKLNIEHG